MDGSRFARLLRPFRWLAKDHALEHLHSLVRMRQHEVAAIVEEAARPPVEEGDAIAVARLARAHELVEAVPPAEYVAANELLDRLDAVLPLVADDVRLRLLVEAELDRADTVLGEAARSRTRELLKAWRGGEPGRRQLEAVLVVATRERNERTREARITSELRRNYLIWFGIALGILLALVSVAAVLAERYALWADVLLAVSAGGLGGTFSGLIRIRAPEDRLAALKNVGIRMLVQPLVGALGGLVLFALWRSGVFTVTGLDRASWASILAVSFAGGFSERLVLRGLGRVRGADDEAEGARGAGPDARR